MAPAPSPPLLLVLFPPLVPVRVVPRAIGPPLFLDLRSLRDRTSALVLPCPPARHALLARLFPHLLLALLERLHELALGLLFLGLGFHLGVLGLELLLPLLELSEHARDHHLDAHLHPRRVVFWHRVVLALLAQLLLLPLDLLLHGVLRRAADTHAKLVALWVIESLGSFLDNLECRLRALVARVFIGVNLDGQLAIGALHLLWSRLVAQTKHLKWVHVEVLGSRAMETSDMITPRHGLHVRLQLLHLLEKQRELRIWRRRLLLSRRDEVDGS
mmetsp:Transcript_32267/g.55215  ORF Transcript_32267/g.55215 Transcript_32267/m.55215 type:complete len:273 (-) Transcript_32267:13-831(-)